MSELGNYCCFYDWFPFMSQANHMSSILDIQEFYEVTLLDNPKCTDNSKHPDPALPVNIWDFSSPSITTVTSETLPSSLSGETTFLHILLRKWSVIHETRRVLRCQESFLVTICNCGFTSTQQYHACKYLGTIMTFIP